MPFFANAVCCFLRAFRTEVHTESNTYHCMYLHRGINIHVCVSNTKITHVSLHHPYV